MGVAAEVHVLRRATEETGGTYGVALNESHLQELLLAHAPAPPAPVGQLVADLVRMGFPQRAPEEDANAVYVGEVPVLHAGGYTCPRCKARTQELPCSCHVCGLTLISSPHLARSYHHLFPVGPYEEVPPKEVKRLAAAAVAAAEGGGMRRKRAGRDAMEVDEELKDDLEDGVGAGGGGVKGLVNGGVGEEDRAGFKQLQPPWDERGGGLGDGEEEDGVLLDDKKDAAALITAAAAGGGEYHQRELVCYGCLRLLAGDEEGMDGDGGAAAGADMVLRCPQCKQLFCYECDAFVHETLHNCPGCECGLAAAG